MSEHLYLQCKINRLIAPKLNNLETRHVLKNNVCGTSYASEILLRKQIDKWVDVKKVNNSILVDIGFTLIRAVREQIDKRSDV